MIRTVGNQDKETNQDLWQESIFGNCESSRQRHHISLSGRAHNKTYACSYLEVDKFSRLDVQAQCRHAVHAPKL